MIRIKDLQKSYGEKPVLSHFSHDLPDNGIVCLTGASGRGKTTLLRILAGLETADGGSVTGLSGRKIAFVFQEDRLLPWITAQQNIRLAQPAGAKRPVGELLALEVWIRLTDKNIPASCPAASGGGWLFCGALRF